MATRKDTAAFILEQLGFDRVQLLDGVFCKAPANFLKADFQESADSGVTGLAALVGKGLDLSSQERGKAHRNHFGGAYVLGLGSALNDCRCMVSGADHFAVICLNCLHVYPLNYTICSALRIPFFMARSNGQQGGTAAPRVRGQFLSEGSERTGDGKGQPEAGGGRPSDALSTSWGTMAG